MEITKEDIDKLSGYEKTLAIRRYHEWMKEQRKKDKFDANKEYQRKLYHLNKDKSLFKEKGNSVFCVNCGTLQSTYGKCKCINCGTDFEDKK